MKTFWKKLIKFLMTISLLFILAFPSFADYTIEDYEKLLTASVIAIEETNNLLKEANEKIISLEKQITESDSAQCENLLKKTGEALEDSNEKLKVSNERIKSDQVEIIDLRNNLQDCINNIQEPQMFTLGGGYTYPGGVQIFFMFDIPKIPISVYTNGNILMNPFGLNFTIGAAYRF